MTNRKKLNQMGNEEFAVFLTKIKLIDICEFCDQDRYDCDSSCCEHGLIGDYVIYEKWLESEVEDGILI